MSELVVSPPVSAELCAAIRAALEHDGVSVEERPRAYAGAWRLASAREAVENEPRSPRGWSGRYTLSPRSTRGATRA